MDHWSTELVVPLLEGPKRKNGGHTGLVSRRFRRFDLGSCPYVISSKFFSDKNRDRISEPFLIKLMSFVKTV